MSHITIRRLTAGVAAIIVALSVGGSGFANDDPVASAKQQQNETEAPPRVTSLDLPPLDPSKLHGEIKNAHPDQKSWVLGPGDVLEKVVADLVTQIDPALPGEELTRTVNRLVYGDETTNGIRQQAPNHADLDVVDPGVEVTVKRSFQGQKVLWVIVADGYSGFEQE